MKDLFYIIYIFFNVKLTFSETPLITITSFNLKKNQCVDGYFYFNLIVNIYNSCDETKFEIYLGSPEGSKAFCILPERNLALVDLKTSMTLECKIDTAITPIENVNIAFSASPPQINGNIELDKTSYESYTKGKLVIIKSKASCSTIPDTLVFTSEEINLDNTSCIRNNNTDDKENEDYIIFKIKGKVNNITDEVNFNLVLNEPKNKTVSCSLGSVSDTSVTSYIKCKIKDDGNKILSKTNIKFSTQRMRDKTDTTIVLKIIQPNVNSIVIPDCETNYSFNLKIYFFYYIISLLFIFI